MIDVSTDRFEFDHGHRPHGRGSWAFNIGGKIEWISGDIKYSVARKAAIAIAKGRGVDFIEVLP